MQLKISRIVTIVSNFYPSLPRENKEDRDVHMEAHVRQTGRGLGIPRPAGRHHGGHQLRHGQGHIHV